MPTSVTHFPAGSVQSVEFDGTIQAELAHQIALAGAFMEHPSKAIYAQLAGAVELAVPFGPGELYRLGRSYRDHKAGASAACFSLDFRCGTAMRLQLDAATVAALFSQADLFLQPGADPDAAVPGHFVLTYLEEQARSGDLGWAFGDTVDAGSYES